jgi:hypothetical protein
MMDDFLFAAGFVTALVLVFVVRPLVRFGLRKIGVMPQVPAPAPAPTPVSPAAKTKARPRHKTR